MAKTICERCGKEFVYFEEFSFPGGLDKEDVSCPYCGHSNFQIMTSGIIKTQKI